jgi:hypothetical protein
MARPICGECDWNDPSGAKILTCCKENDIVTCKTPLSMVGQFVKGAGDIVESILGFVGLGDFARQGKEFFVNAIEYIPIIGGGNKTAFGPLPISPGMVAAPSLDGACKAIGPALSGSAAVSNPWAAPATGTAPETKMYSPRHRRF